ncbi:hypothetical protein LCGC14_1860980 [marine sediment metagenome]|uniref:Uncharacterized protein n=1 Tax=marine sediment metagenome TaxID=412755 RepID=A0A0F9G7K9_9ZZZZ
MKAVIDYEHKIVEVGVRDHVEAGWTGFYFAKDNRDLVEAGWILWFFRPDSFPCGTPEASYFSGIQEVADKIREGPPCTHSCRQHEAVG